MIEGNFGSVIDALGKSESEVIIALGLLPGMKNTIEEDSFFYSYDPEAGVEFVFDMDTSNFVEVHITLKLSSIGSDVYAGTLPFGISQDWNREAALSALGEPTKSWAPSILPLIGDVGGTDSFAIADHVDLELMIGYSISWNVEQISIMHKNRPI